MNKVWIFKFDCSKFGYLGFVRTLLILNMKEKKSQKVFHILNGLWTIAILVLPFFPSFFVYEKTFLLRKGQHREALTGKKTTIYFIYYNGPYNSLWWAKKVPNVAFYISYQL